MKKIKILFVLGTLEIGGTERQFIEVLRRLNRERFEPSVLSFSDDGRLREEIQALHVPLTLLDFSGLKGKYHVSSYIELGKFLRAMIQYMRREKPDIVQSYLFWANIYAAIAAKFAKIPIIITGRRELVDMSFLHWHYRWLLFFSNAIATRVLANSQRAERECITQERFLNSQKVLIIRNGIDVDKYAITASEKRALLPENGISKKRYTVGVLANLHACKGIDTFLQAAVSVLQVYPETRFLIIGRDTGMYRQLRQLAEDLQIVKSIIFTGERSDIPELLSILDVQVSSSRTESLSNAILEGMASGKAIIATSVGGSSELIVDGQNGLLIPPDKPEILAQAIIRLLHDKSLRYRLGKAARDRANANFNMNIMIRCLEELYVDLLAVYHPQKSS